MSVIDDPFNTDVGAWITMTTSQLSDYDYFRLFWVATRQEYCYLLSDMCNLLHIGRVSFIAVYLIFTYIVCGLS